MSDMKTKGIINSSRNIEDRGVSTLLLPYFFVGQRLDDDLSPLLRDLLTQDGPVDWEEAEKALKLSGLRDGQFFLDHQFGGHRCVQAQMFGAFFPLALCGQQGIANELLQLIDKYDVAYSDGLGNAIADFKSLGLPIHEQYLDGEIRYDHALLKIADTDSGLTFLRQNGFSYVTGIGGMNFEEYAERARVLGLTTLPNRTERWLDEKPPGEGKIAAWQLLLSECEKSRHIAKSAPSEWKSSTEFARWLSRGPGFEVAPGKIIMALAYENYD